MPRPTPETRCENCQWCDFDKGISDPSYYCYYSHVQEKRREADAWCRHFELPESFTSLEEKMFRLNEKTETSTEPIEEKEEKPIPRNCLECNCFLRVPGTFALDCEEAYETQIIDCKVVPATKNQTCPDFEKIK